MIEPSNPEYPDRPCLAVGAVVFRHNKVLLVQRGRPPARNQWAIPGGRVRLGETLQQAAEREVLEETGIEIIAHEPVLTFDVVERDKEGRVRYHYVIVDLDAQYAGGRLHPGDDARDARWTAEYELRKLDVNRRTRMFLKEKYQFG